jgi:hypothetical protein
MMSDVFECKFFYFEFITSSVSLKLSDIRGWHDGCKHVRVYVAAMIMRRLQEACLSLLGTALSTSLAGTPRLGGLEQQRIRGSPMTATTRRLQ